jgi:hypothetical protein
MPLPGRVLGTREQEEDEMLKVKIAWSRASRRGWLLSGAAAIAAAGAAGAASFGDWGPAMNAERLRGSSNMVNTSANDGCPILDPGTNDLYMASNRPGGQGGLDIWIAKWNGAGWGTPVNAGPGVNTRADEFCPDPATGGRLFFVRRLTAKNTDIYVAQRLASGSFTAPQRLSNAVNSAAEEWSPSFFTAGSRQYLYFSSTREGRQRIYYSVNFGPASLAPGGVNSSAADARPNVRQDGLEIGWDSTRFGTLGGPDIWSATRSSLDEPWGTAVHLGNGINSAAGESRASLSFDGHRLMFGTTRAGEGSSDIWTATR